MPINLHRRLSFTRCNQYLRIFTNIHPNIHEYPNTRRPDTTSAIFALSSQCTILEKMKWKRDSNLRVLHGGIQIACMAATVFLGLSTPPTDHVPYLQRQFDDSPWVPWTPFATSEVDWLTFVKTNAYYITLQTIYHNYHPSSVSNATILIKHYNLLHISDSSLLFAFSL